MRLTIPKDYFTGNPIPPEIYLCNTGKTKIGVLPAYDTSGAFKWGANYSELSFSVDKTYTDMITGEQKTHPLFSKVDVPRNIYAENIGYFSIQDVDTEYGEKVSRHVTCFAYEYATLVHKYLNNFKVNAGTIDSVEVLYHEKQYGMDYVIDQDNMYKLATEAYDPGESYYIEEYVDKSYVWTQVQVSTAEDYATYFNGGENSRTPLYIKNYPNVRFYWESKPELSLLNLILDKNAPEWKVGHVDATLRRKERKFEIDRQDIYSFLTNEIADTFNCVVEFDSIKGEINFYEELDDGMTADGKIDPQWDTNVIVSKDNLASQIEVKYSGDDIRTKLKLSSGEGVNIREVNLGSDYIMNLDYYHTPDWMERDLFEAYDDYKEANKTYAPLYEAEMKNWVAANNKYHDVVHAVPAENDVVMIDDIFEKLYCVFGAINTAFTKLDENRQEVEVTSSTAALTELYYDVARMEVVDKNKLSDGEMFVVQGYQFNYDSSSKTFTKGDNLADTTLLTALKEKLYLYQVHKDAKGNVQDNILLTLRNVNSDTATIRIYAPKIAIYPKSGMVTYDDNEHYYTRSGTEDNYTYTEVTKFPEDKSFTSYDTLYINDYHIRCVVVRNKTGLTDVPVERPIIDWLRGNLTAQTFGMIAQDKNDNNKWFPDFTVKGIGTMGAYLVISKNEYVYINDDWVPSKDYLRNYGVKLLQEKADVYLKIFQTQTEAVYQDEGYQCIAQDAEPNGGNVAIGTRWFKTNGKPPVLYVRNGESDSAIDWLSRWDEITRDVNPADYENYQRYMDNFNKLVVTQEVLQEKEQQAEYLLNGYAVISNPIYYDEYTKGDDGNYRRNGQLLEGDMHRAALAHFCGTQAYASQAVDGSSKWNTISDLYLNTYKDKNGATKFINQIDKTKLQGGARYQVDGYAYQYDAIANNFKRAYNSVYITRNSMDQELPLYTFTTVENPYSVASGTFDESEIYYIKSSNGPHEIKKIASQEEYDTYDGKSKETTLYVRNLYAVYLQGNTPYVAYASSQGVYQMKKDYIIRQTALENFFNDDQRIRLSPFIREDEYTNDNIVTTQYDSEEEKLRIFKEFVEEASKELQTLSQPSLEFSMTMANILALPEFAPLVDDFQLGKFIRVDIDGDYSKRARLLEVTLNFDDLSDFNCTFGDLKTTKDQVDLHAELLAQSVQAGSTVAKNKAGWQSAVDVSHGLEEAIATGLQDAALQVGRANGQAITWDERGFYCRKFVDGTTDQYQDEQIAIINNKICFTRDGWKTSSAALGEFQVDINGDGKPETMYGLVADAVVSGYIQGSEIFGGRMEIGGKGGRFIVNEDGSVEIIGPEGNAKYAAKELEDAYRFQILLEYDGLTVFLNRLDDCVVTCKVYDNTVDITDQVLAQEGSTFVWSKSLDPSWMPTYIMDAGGNPIPNKILITHEDVERNAQFACAVTFDETEFNTEGGASEE
jgi:hypothetical protein